MWPTGGWGSIEYGSPVPGQLVGGRWKPLHYALRASTFNDHVATCNTAGACFVTNDSPFPFTGAVEIRVLNVLAGTSANFGVNTSLPAGPKVSQWFCASPSAANPRSAPDATDAAAERSGRQAPYTHVAGAVPCNRSSWNEAARGSIADCEAACDGLPGCLGFTYDEWHGVDCWLYPASVVQKLAADARANWYQKPGTKSLPIVPLPPRPPNPPHPPPPPAPPRPPLPTPPPATPFPEPPQLECTRWNAMSEWKTAGCDATGTNCVLSITVRSSTGVPRSWSVLPFLPPRQMRLALATVTATVNLAGSGSAAIELSSNATALYVVLTTHAPGRFEDNAVLLEAGTPQTIGFVPWGPLDVGLLRTTLRVEHLADNL